MFQGKQVFHKLSADTGGISAREAREVAQGHACKLLTVKHSPLILLPNKFIISLLILFFPARASRRKCVWSTALSISLRKKACVKFWL